MYLTIDLVNQVLKPKNQQIFEQKRIEHITIDSRSPQNNQNTLFFAIQGNNFDGHFFIQDLISKGVQNFVVSNIPNGLPEKANFYEVENTLEAFQKLAAYYRSLFHFPILGITGSNGKTIVKEWLNYLLSPEYQIIRSPKSYNSQIGVPLSIFGINEEHNFGIFEAGISTIDEMEHLQEIIKPTLGILTNIGTAHDEGFENKNQKLIEKLKLFKEISVLIHQKNGWIENFTQNIPTFTWSFTNNQADVSICIRKKEKNSLISIDFQNVTNEIEIPFLDDASIENAIQCIVLMIYLKYDFELIKERCLLLFPLEMRLKLKKGIYNTTLIDDSYSSDYQSFKIALDFLKNQNIHQKSTIIVSDIVQSGLNQETLYLAISQLIAQNQLDRIITIGTEIFKHQDKFKNVFSFQTMNDFLASFSTFKFENETILIKGARHFQFEKIVKLLQEKTHETVLEINTNALIHNLNYYKNKLNASTKIMVMIKAFGYGNGGVELAKILEYQKVDYLGVAFADEGIILKNNGIKTPIMVLNPEATSYESIIKNGLEPEIYSFKGLRNFITICQEKNIVNYPIHLKIDTGMHRLGFEAFQIPELILALKNQNQVKIISILSHLATSDDLQFIKFTNSQISNFTIIAQDIENQLGKSIIKHLLNSSGISNFTAAQMDMVRLGIGLYGISNDVNEQKYLENVSTLKSVISQIKTIQPQDSVGYGRRFIAQQITKSATIPIGYADGISRALGNGLGYVMINQQKAVILGSVCMDMIMVDVTHINCEEGDEVIIFGKQPTLTEIAQKTNTIAYEVIAGISQRVKRVFYRE
jgi:Alr-MurF fusion protein